VPNYVSLLTDAHVKDWAGLVKKTGLVAAMEQFKVDKGAVDSFSKALAAYVHDVKGGAFGGKASGPALDAKTKALKPLLAQTGAASKQDFGTLTRFVAVVEKELASFNATLKQLAIAKGRVAAEAPKAELAWASWIRGAGASSDEVEKLLAGLSGCAQALTLGDSGKWQKFGPKLAQLGQLISKLDAAGAKLKFDKELRAILKEAMGLAKAP
jgi:hypothetical protein